MSKVIPVTQIEDDVRHPQNPEWLHNEFGPAKVMDKPGFNEYYYENVRVPKAWIEERETFLTAKVVDNTANTEMRRVALKLLGLKKYMQQSNPEVLDMDKDQFGRERILFKKLIPGYEDPLIICQVTNSTQELDGSYNQYFLFCHPELKPLHDPGIKADDKPEVIKKKQEEAMRRTNAEKGQAMTCHNAVASTFGLRGEEYGLNGHKRQGDVYIRMFTGQSANDPFSES